MVSPARTPLRQASATRLPIRMVRIALSAKTAQWPRPWAISTSIGNSMATPRAMTRRPTTYPTWRISNMTRRVGLAPCRCQAGYRARPGEPVGRGPFRRSDVEQIAIDVMHDIFATQADSGQFLVGLGLERLDLSAARSNAGMSLEPDGQGGKHAFHPLEKPSGSMRNIGGQCRHIGNLTSCRCFQVSSPLRS